jgi:hypothetical protein
MAQDTRTVDAMHRLVHSLATELKNITGSGKQLMRADPWTHARWFELSANVQVLLDADPTDTFGDRAELFGKSTSNHPLPAVTRAFSHRLLVFAAAMETARSTGLDWATWYTQRECEMPDAASMAHCATFPNATTCNADKACQFVDNLACKAVDTDCFPCRDAESKECPQAVEEYFCNHGVNTAQSLKFVRVHKHSAVA